MDLQYTWISYSCAAGNTCQYFELISETANRFLCLDFNIASDQYDFKGIMSGCSISFTHCSYWVVFVFFLRVKEKGRQTYFIINLGNMVSRTGERIFLLFNATVSSQII